MGRSSESSDGGLRQSLELLRKGKVNIEGEVDVLVHEVSLLEPFSGLQRERVECTIRSVELELTTAVVRCFPLACHRRSNRPTPSQRSRSCTG